MAEGLSVDSFESLFDTALPLSPLTESDPPTPSPVSFDKPPSFENPTPHPTTMSSNNHFEMPLTNSKNAPKFGRSFSEFESFFEEVEELGRRAGLDVASKIRWARKYAGMESDSWQYVPCMVHRNGPTDFKEFKEQVMQRYPNLDKNHRYTNDDLYRHIESCTNFVGMTRDDFGDYSRKFTTISEFLISKGRLSARERNILYLRGFPQQVRNQILQRLSIRKSDVLPEEGYELQDVDEAALFVFNAGGHAFAVNSSITNPPSVTIVPPSSNPSIAVTSYPQPPPFVPDPSSDSKKIDSLLEAMSSLTRALSVNLQPPVQPQRVPQQQLQRFVPQTQNPPAQQYPTQNPTNPAPLQNPTPGGVQQPPPQAWQRPPPRRCAFCGSMDHLVRFCAPADQYVHEGKASRTQNNRLCLPNGQQLPDNLPGYNLREKFEYWWSTQGNRQPTVEANFLEGIDECIFSFDVSSSAPAETFDDSPDEVAKIEAEIQRLQAQAYAFSRSKRQQFDGVDPPRRGPPNFNPKEPKESFPPPNVDSGKRDAPPHLSKDSTTSSHSAGKPGARAGSKDVPPQRNQGPMKPVDFPSKSSEEQKHRYHSPIESSAKASDLADRALDTQITISTRELLAASSEVRRQVKDLVTSRKVAVNVLETEEEIDSYLSSCLENTVASTPVDFDRYKPTTSSAAHALPLRVIRPKFGDGVSAECILDSGAQVVIMRKDIWEKLGIPIVADKLMNLEAANSARTMTMGLLEDLPVHLGSVTVFLQVQVIEEAPFEVLLGRPFFDVLSCSEVSSPGGNHQLHIKDPKTGTPYVFTTQPRVTNRDSSSNTIAAVNFRR